jgi:MFS family permease
MSVTTADSVPKKHEGLSWLWHRELDTYPDTGPRMTYLAITVIATIMLYYELYVGGSVSTLFLVKLHMSFTFLVYTLAIGAVIGAFGSLFAGVTDRLGRTNIVVIGLGLTAVFTAFIIPASTNKWEFTIFGFIVGFVEGICLVATPALIRDFSPQVGRGTAMGFWTSGPVLGSLVVFVVASHVIHGNPSPDFWVTLYHICGIVGLVVFALALVGLRELSPGLRDQLMVSMQDRALIEARAKGLDIEASLRNPFGQLIKPDVVISAIGISVFLLIYYTAVGFALIYFTTVFAFTVHQGDALGNWNWGFNVIAVIAFGFISDKLRVRKPLMILGGVGAAIMIVLYLTQIGKPTSYYHMAVLLAALAFTLGVAYVPWMASFTETVEARNPALTATGLAIWGWIIRMVVFASYLILPAVVNTVTPLVTYGSTVAAASTKYASELAFLQTAPGQQAVALAPELTAIADHPAIFAGLAANPNSAALQAAAARAVGPTMLASIAQHQAAITTLLTQHGTDLAALANAQKDPAFQTLIKHGASVAHAAKTTGSQWKTWYWICFGGVIFFLFTVPLMKGRWSPKAAKQDEEAHEAMVQSELAKLSAATV